MSNSCLLIVFLWAGLASLAQANAVEPNVNRGQELFANFCFLCHGQQGKGDGRMAKLLQTAPANLRKSQLDNKALAEIIRKGGAGVNRSEQMPAWGDQFTAIDVQSLVLFIKSLQEKPMDADKAKKRAAIK